MASEREQRHRCQVCGLMYAASDLFDCKPPGMKVTCRACMERDQHLKDLRQLRVFVGPLPCLDYAISQLKSQPATVAAAAEEMRERCAKIVDEWMPYASGLAAAIRAMPVEPSGADPFTAATPSPLAISWTTSPLDDNTIHYIACEIDHDLRCAETVYAGEMRVRWNNRAAGMLIATVQYYKKQLEAARTVEPSGETPALRPGECPARNPVLPEDPPY